MGRAVARRLLDFCPARIVLVSLHEREVREAAAVLRPAAGTTDIVTEWGNVFFPRPWLGSTGRWCSKMPPTGPW